jgi:hypothetical protein
LSVKRPVSVPSSLQRHIPASPDPELRMWGTSLRSRLQWSKAKAEDVLLFAKQGLVFAFAQCYAKVDIPELASAAWGSPEWRYLYILAAPTFVSVPAERISQALAYSTGFKIQRHLTLTPDQSKAVFGALDLPSSKPRDK